MSKTHYSILSVILLLVLSACHSLWTAQTQPAPQQESILVLPTTDIPLPNTDFAFLFPEEPKLYEQTSPRKNITPYAGRRKHHSGVDLKTCANDTIISAFDGIVRLAKPYYAYGNVIVVRHYNGLETVYSHNSKNLVKPGDYVKAGQPIALTGRTGRATTEHLHFEVRVNGQHFNPNLVFDLQERKLNNQCLVFTQKGGKIAVKPVELMPHQFAGDYSYSPASCKNKEQIESKKETL